MKVEIKNISKRYKEKCVLDNINITIPSGKIFGLLGPNGAGKTTLIRTLTGINQPDSGVIFYNNEALSLKQKEKIGYLPEERGLYTDMTVKDQLSYLGKLRSMPKDEIEQNIKQLLLKMNLTDRKESKITELSKGNQQKIQFIACILNNPDFIILDEPFSGLDPINTAIIKKEIIELKNNGSTILLSTHDMVSVEELCDEIALINQGKILLSGNTQDIRKSYKQSIPMPPLPKEEEYLPSMNDIFLQTVENR